MWDHLRNSLCFPTAPARSLASRLQLDSAESNVGREQCDYGESSLISCAQMRRYACVLFSETNLLATVKTRVVHQVWRSPQGVRQRPLILVPSS